VYNVHVDCDENSWDLTYTVKEGRFERQDLSIDTSSPQITEANSPAAYAQYREKVYPLYETSDAQRYWEGNFIRPVDWEAKLCRISSPYGIFRYTNGNPTPRRHPALDIAAPNGTPVFAPNNGRVVMAEYLLNTGNTMVVEYGGGLKSYFFHLSAMSVNTGDMVEKGQEIAKVGSTGYSTGPHLHFEMRVGKQSLDPMLLMNGQSAIFF
jgi:murein DD-endopeptidase MepM/ murein hydrolase activator NlpD